MSAGGKGAGMGADGENEMRLLDRVDWPNVGDEVLYHQGSTGRWVPAIVRAVAEHDGDLRLDVGDGIDALDVKHGPQRHGWLLYGEQVTPPADTARAEQQAHSGGTP